MGMLGMWTGALHEEDDPVGKYMPFEAFYLPYCHAMLTLSILVQESCGNGASVSRRSPCFVSGVQRCLNLGSSYVQVSPFADVRMTALCKYY